MTRVSLLSRLIRGASIAFDDLTGWRIEGRAPAVPKFVLVGAPHTSNWDFVIFLAATHKLGIRPSFIGKHTLFRWPLKRLMNDMGGIAIDRSKRAHYVDQVVSAFDGRDELALVVAPEGTRSSDGSWRSGFYHIAVAAGVPVVPAWLSLDQRRVKIGDPIEPTGDYRADLARIALFYREAEPGNPRFANIARDPASNAALSNPPQDTLGG